MLGHLSFGVADLQRAQHFYDAALAPLGYVRLWQNERGAGYGPVGAADEPFAIFHRGAEARPPGPGFHLALRAANRDAVARFHEAALAAGGQDNGAPGLRAHYGPGYYAAFVRDPDGHRLEAVCHELVGDGV